MNTNIRSEGAYNYYHCIDPVALSLYEDANKASKRGKDTPIPEQTSVHPEVEQNRGPSSSSSPGQKLKEQFFKPSKTKSSLPVATPPEIRSNVISKEERMKNQAPFGLQGVPTSKMNNELKAFLSDLDEPKEKSREGSPTSSPPIPSGKEAPPTKRNTMGPLTILAMPSATHPKAMLSTTHPKATPSVTHPNLSRQPPELGWERVIPRSSWILSPSDAIKQNLCKCSVVRWGVVIWQYGNKGVWQYGGVVIWDRGVFIVWGVVLWVRGNRSVWYGCVVIWSVVVLGCGNIGVWKYGGVVIWGAVIWGWGNMGCGNMGCGNMGCGNMGVW